MTSKITRSLDALLKHFDWTNTKSKPNVVMLYAKAPVAGKLISVVEVIKREIAGTKGENTDRSGLWFQYNALGETMKAIPRKVLAAGKEIDEGKEKDVEAMDMDREDEDNDEGIDESVFETMKAVKERIAEGTDKMRAVPVLSIYLSRVRIEKLKSAYGEQTNSTT